jgi:lipopolysaccharide transport system ATP-binding protein
MGDDLAISVRDVTKHYMIYSRPEDRLKQSVVPRLQRLVKREPTKYFTDFAALSNVSFDVGRGETVGIIGRNGCGKSTILQVVCGILQPSAGAVEVNGRIAALLELGAGFNPEFTGRENVYMNGAILGLSQKEMNERFDQIAAFADIGAFIEQPVKTYSSGMCVRLAFAVAINVDPDILVIDEALAVGDVAFQRKCFARLEQISERGGTILFVSHSTGSIVELCDRAILLDGGELLLDGKPKRVTNQYLKLVHMPAEKLVEAREKVRAMQELPDEDEPEAGEKDAAGAADTAQDKTAQPVANGAARGEESDEERQQRLEEEEGWFDPNLKSQSVVEYESRGARIRDLRILAPSGRQVNVLKMGQRYTYEYYVDFDKMAENVVFGMMIKTVNGMELAGANNDRRKELRIKRVEDGQSMKITFEFECRLMPNAYFGTAGVMGTVDEEHDFLHRNLDLIAFRVMPGSEMSEFDNGHFGLDTRFDAVVVGNVNQLEQHQI